MQLRIFRRFAALEGAELTMPFRIAAVLLAGTGILFGQIAYPSNIPLVPAQTNTNLQPNANIKRYTVSGTVYNTLTSEPIARALVHLNGTEQHVAFTGQDGRFEIQNVPEGQVWITAQRPGYFAPNDNRGGSRFQVGSSSNDFRVPLTPESKITGKVLDSQGEPVEGIQVQVFGAQIIDGHKQWMPREGSSTDDDGEYRLEGQMPGAVIVCTGTRPRMYTRESRETYPPRCYPNAPDVESAQAIQVAPGQPAQADFTVDPVRAYRISGTVAGVNGNVGGWLEGPSGLPGMGVMINPRTHHFDLGPVPNGTWKIHFQEMEGRGNALQTEEEVTVNGADVTNLQVVLSPGVDVPVEFVQPAAATSEQASAGAAMVNGPNAGLPVVRLHRPGENVFFGNVPMAVPDPNNPPGAPPRQIFKNVSPGTYKVSVQTVGGCVASVASGGVDLLEQPLTIAAGSSPQPIIVTQRSDCGSLEVTVHSDHPEDQATLLLVPETPGLEASTMGIAGGTFTFQQLTPGTYHVYAVSDASDLEYSNPDAMRDISGQTVTIDPSQKATVNLTVVERKK
ncbi:MAG TPA: carboxypeptidase regulatory-like domain-containing protein [Bryobacteraceae bacterium]|jgi:hypothetical protein|nr:carboxypeptidase regulatory-like domain-containing protein [Bryobacteraceae bacterium]